MPGLTEKLPLAITQQWWIYIFNRDRIPERRSIGMECMSFEGVASDSLVQQSAPLTL
jgi:hypothetical protein